MTIQGNRSVLPDWMLELPLQQQSVLLLGLRGPDGVRKHHMMKDIQRHYRGTILMAAKYGRFLRVGEKADTFMSLDMFSDAPSQPTPAWIMAVQQYFDSVDEIPHHFHMHLMHGAQILGFKHPSLSVSIAWHYFYAMCVSDAHLVPEPEEVMDHRLGDWGRKGWEQ